MGHNTGGGALSNDMINPDVFREYDIRGTVPADLNRETVTELGRGIGTYYREKGAHRVSLGRDCRLSSPDLSEWLAHGLSGSGVDVVDVGMVPTPLLYFSLHHLDVDGGVQITGSHNPPEFNGFKVCLGHMSVHGEEIQVIREIIEARAFASGDGRRSKTAVNEPYLSYLLDHVEEGNAKRRVMVDAGNGVGGPLACEAYRRMGMEVIPLFCEPDGRFPHHHPDPTLPENLRALASKVGETSADLGIGFDGDADRIGVVDGTGDIIWGDRLLILFARDLLSRHPGATIIGDVKCSQTLYEDIALHGGKGIMWKAGHSLIKSKMKDEAALLAGEMSGHIFFAERYLGYDDAIYAGARLLEILSRDDSPLSGLLKDIPDTVSTPEIRLDCPDRIKFRVVAELAEGFKKDHEVIDVDGARVLFEDGWGLIRASNTQPAVVLRFEAADRERLEEIRAMFMERLERVRGFEDSRIQGIE